MYQGRRIRDRLSLVRLYALLGRSVPAGAK